MVQRHPTFPFRHAVEGMLQRSTLGHDQLKRLKVYPGEAHPHAAQRPVKIRFGRRGEVETIG
jgi:large subunit ribosomal protein L13